MELETMLVVLKDMNRMFLCEGEIFPASDDGTPGCIKFQKPLGIGWQPIQGGKVSMTLSLFPLLINLLVKDYGKQSLVILLSEVAWYFTASDLTPEVKTDYHNKKMELYGGLQIVKTLPGHLKGQA